MIKPTDLFRIGRLGKPHGVYGELDFQFTDDIFDTADADYVFLDIDGIPVPFFISEYRFRSDDIAIIKFDGIDTEDAAREFTGCDVLFPRSLAEKAGAAPSIDALIGFKVTDDATGDIVGTLKAIDDTTENVLFTIATVDGREVLLPASGGLVKDVDSEQQTITMEIAEGLLNL